MSFRTQAFKPQKPSSTASLAVTTSTGRVAIPGNPSQVRLTTKSGDALAFIEFGDGTVVATTSGIPLNPGVETIFSVPLGATNIAAITGATTATLYITPGEGV